VFYCCDKNHHNAISELHPHAKKPRRCAFLKERLQVE
jgi:hypothetical protein